MRIGAKVVTTAALGSRATDPSSGWYHRLDKPAFQPPPAAFPIVWSSLYAAIWAASTSTIRRFEERGDVRAARRFERALSVNLALNAGWSAVFFRAHRLPAATAVAAALTASSVGLARRAAPVGRGRSLAFGAYAAWCGFATLLSGRLARLNKDRSR